MTLTIPRRVARPAERESPEQLSDGRWVHCRHWCPPSMVGPDPHRHVDDPLYVSDPYVPTPSKGRPPKEKA
jgi:hypothetical protein